MFSLKRSDNPILLDNLTKISTLLHKDEFTWLASFTIIQERSYRYVRLRLSSTIFCNFYILKTDLQSYVIVINDFLLWDNKQGHRIYVLGQFFLSENARKGIVMLKGFILNQQSHLHVIYFLNEHENRF